MKVEISKKKEEAASKEVVEDELPEDKKKKGADVEEDTDEDTADLDEITDDGDDGEDEVASRHQLEVDKARLEGELRALKGDKTKPADQKRQYIQQVYADLAMEDDTFKEKYRGYNKAQVVAAVHDEVNADSNSKISRLEAKNSLSRKYDDFIDHEDAIDEALADANPAVLQDPVRLKKFMERTYIAASKEAENKAPTKMKGKVSKEEPVKRIVKDFQPPTPKGGGNDEDDDEGQDQIKEEDRGLAAKFGLHSEKQRKKYMTSFIPMNLGGGVVFEDPKKGFEKRKPVAAK